MELIEEYTRVIKIEEGYPHAKTLYLPSGEIDGVVDWCNKNYRQDGNGKFSHQVQLTHQVCMHSFSVMMQIFLLLY